MTKCLQEYYKKTLYRKQRCANILFSTVFIKRSFYHNDSINWQFPRTTQNK